MKKILKKVHLYLSIPVGVLVSLICFTGAILVFETEITEKIYKSRYYLNEVGSERLPVSEIIQKVSTELPDSVSISNIQIPSDKRRTYKLDIEGKGRTSIYANPYTGEIVEIYTYDPNSFFAQVKQLHRWLMFKNDNRIIGKRIVGVSTILMIVIIITGLVVWLPKNRKGLSHRLKVRFKSGFKIFLYDLHVTGGFYITLLLLVMAFTGLTWSFDWYRNAFYAAFGAKSLQSQQDNKQGRTSNLQEGQNKQEINYIVWDKAVEQTLGVVKSYKNLIVTNDHIKVVSDSEFGNSRAFHRYIFDSTTGILTGKKLYEQQPRQDKLRGLVYSIHTGSWGGIWVKFIYFITVIVGGLLPITGYYMYAKRKFRKY